jgi:hypothetical protein
MHLAIIRKNHPKTAGIKIEINMFEICKTTETDLLIAFSRDAATKLRSFGEHSAALILEAIANDMSRGITT